MISKTIKYEDFNGDQVEKTFHFHINKAELAEMNYEEGRASLVERMVEVSSETTNIREVLDIFKSIIVEAVGKRSEDGSRFIKNDDVRSELMDTEAYSELLFGMLDSPENAANFIQGMLPPSVQKEIDKSAGGKKVSELSREELLAKLKEVNDSNNAPKED